MILKCWESVSEAVIVLRVALRRCHVLQAMFVVIQVFVRFVVRDMFVRNLLLLRYLVLDWGRTVALELWSKRCVLLDFIAMKW